MAADYGTLSFRKQLDCQIMLLGRCPAGSSRIEATQTDIKTLLDTYEAEISKDLEAKYKNESESGQRRITELEEEHSQHTQKVADLTKIIEQQKQEITRLRTQVDDMKTHVVWVDQSNGFITKFGTLLDGLAPLVDASKSLSESWTKAVTESTRIMQHVNQQSSSLEDKVSEVTLSLDALHVGAADLTSTCSDAKDDINTVKDGVVKTKDQIVTAKNDILIARDEIVTAKNDIVTAKDTATQACSVFDDTTSECMKKVKIATSSCEAYHEVVSKAQSTHPTVVSGGSKAVGLVTPCGSIASEANFGDPVPHAQRPRLSFSPISGIGDTSLGTLFGPFDTPPSSNGSPSTTKPATIGNHSPVCQWTTINGQPPTDKTAKLTEVKGLQQPPATQQSASRTIGARSRVATPLTKEVVDLLSDDGNGNDDDDDDDDDDTSPAPSKKRKLDPPISINDMMNLIFVNRKEKRIAFVDFDASLQNAVRELMSDHKPKGSDWPFVPSRKKANVVHRICVGSKYAKTTATDLHQQHACGNCRRVKRPCVVITTFKEGLPGENTLRLMPLPKGDRLPGASACELGFYVN